MVGPGLVGEPKSGTKEGRSQLGYHLLGGVGIRTESPRQIPLEPFLCPCPVPLMPSSA